MSDICDAALENFSLILTSRILYAVQMNNPLRTAEITQYAQDFNGLMAACESPIEQLLASHLVFASDSYSGVAYAPDVDEPYPFKLSYIDTGTILVPQAVIGNYRVDFLLVSESNSRVAALAVECDGHDFHEKTKEQAARDKARDRFLLRQGVSVMRFTGSEIFRDANACIQEIEEAIAQNAESVRKETAGAA